MIQEITDLIFDLIGVGIFGGNHNLSCLLAQFPWGGPCGL